MDLSEILFTEDRGKLLNYVKFGKVCSVQFTRPSGQKARLNWPWSDMSGCIGHKVVLWGEGLYKIKNIETVYHITGDQNFKEQLYTLEFYQTWSWCVKNGVTS